VNALAIDQKTFGLNPTLDNPLNVELAPTFAKKKKKKLQFSSPVEFGEIFVFPPLFPAIDHTNSHSHRAGNRRRNSFLFSFFCITENQRIILLFFKKKKKKTEQELSGQHND